MHQFNQFIYSRERRRFGRQCLFSDRSQPMLSIQPSYKLRLTYILRNPVHRGTQLSDQKAYSIMETENVTYTEHGMYHYEGGWPREVNINDEESTLRYRKKIEREDNWGLQVSNLISTSMEKTAQNSAVNIYEDFFADLPIDLGVDIRLGFEARQMNIFHDPIKPVRPVQVIDWAPSDVHRFLALHTKIRRDITSSAADKDDEEALLADVNLSSFYIWNQENPLKPAVIFEADESVQKALFCPKDDDWVAGGFQSGKVTLWNARIGGTPLQICPLEAAHHESISALCWVHSKSNSEFYTGSYDGSVKYWDGRDLNEPLQEVLLDPEFTDEQRMDRAHGVAVLEFEYTIPVRYIIGSDQGHMFIGNRKGMSPTETLLANYKLFAGPIRTVERNPFFVKNFLIVGDWCAKIWAEECKGSPSTFLIKKKNQLLCGTWSTARCSVFVTGDSKGDLDIWDVLLHQRQPVYTIRLNVPITSVKFRADGEFVAVGLMNGDIQMFELDPALKRSGGKEKALMAALFEREQLRSKLLDGRVEEIKLKRKTSITGGLTLLDEEDPKADMAELDPNDPEQFLQLIEQDLEFKESLRIFKDLTFKVDKKRQEREFHMERTEFEHDFEYDDATSERTILEEQPAANPEPATA